MRDAEARLTCDPPIEIAERRADLSARAVFHVHVLRRVIPRMTRLEKERAKQVIRERQAVEQRLAPLPEREAILRAAQREPVAVKRICFVAAQTETRLAEQFAFQQERRAADLEHTLRQRVAVAEAARAAQHQHVMRKGRRQKQPEIADRFVNREIAAKHLVVPPIAQKGRQSLFRAD